MSVVYIKCIFSRIILGHIPKSTRIRLKGEHETTAIGLNNNASFYHFERKTHVHYGRVRYRGKKLTKQCKVEVF